MLQCGVTPPDRLKLLGLQAVDSVLLQPVLACLITRLCREPSERCILALPMNAFCLVEVMNCHPNAKPPVSLLVNIQTNRSVTSTDGNYTPCLVTFALLQDEVAADTQEGQPFLTGHSGLDQPDQDSGPTPRSTQAGQSPPITCHWMAVPSELLLSLHVCSQFDHVEGLCPPILGVQAAGPLVSDTIQDAGCRQLCG